MDDGTFGVLRHGIVVESEQKAYLTYETEDGKIIIYSGSLSDEEMSAYKRHPETFFGRIEKVGKTAETAMELYEFFYENYKDTPREKLLEWLAGTADFPEIEKLSTENIAFLYAERLTISAVYKNPPPDVVFE
jgi:hypothetical protein